MDPNYLVFFNKRWRFKRVTSIKDGLGSCDSPDKPDKEIKVLKRLIGREELDTLLHEALHACFWHLDEEYVDQAASDLARALWRLGYRKVDE